MAFEFTPPPVDSLEPEAFTPPPLDSLQPMTERDSQWLKLNAERESARVEQDIIDDSSALRRVVADPAIALAKGVISVPEAAVGLASIVSKGQAGKAFEDAGFKFREAKDILSSYQTGEQQMAQGRVAQAKGFIPTVKALVENPTVAAEALIESMPLMFGGGALSQAALAGVKKLGPKFAAWAAGEMAPIVAGAVGEGVVGAGSAAENIRQQSPDRLLTWEQAGYAAASGAGTSALGILGGKVANKLGFDDWQTAMARGGAASAQKVTLPKFKAIIAGALQEGLLEELPQSAQEQMFSNLALGKPWDQGLAEAAAQGFVAGAAMGGFVQAARRGQPAATPATAAPAATPAAPVAPAPAPAPQAATPQVSQRVSTPVQPPPMPKVSGLMLNQPLSTWSTSPSSPNILAQSPDSFGIGNKVVKLSQAGGGFGKVGTVTAMTGPKVDGNPNATVSVTFDDGTTAVSGFKEFGFLENVQQAKAMSEAARGKPFEFPLPPPSPKVALPEPPAKSDSKRTVPLDAAEQLQQRINAARASGDVATARKLAGELDMLGVPPAVTVAPPVAPPATPVATKPQPFEQVKEPTQFNSIEEILQFRKQRINEQIALYQREIGLTRQEAEKLDELMTLEKSTDKFEQAIGPEKAKRLNWFFDESDWNKKDGPFQSWETDKRLNPESLLEETDKDILLSNILSAVQRGVEAKVTSDRFLSAAIAAKKLQEVGGTLSDVARYLDGYTTRESSSQGDKAEFFTSLSEKVGRFFASQGIVLPQGDLQKTGKVAPKPRRTAITPAAQAAAPKRTATLPEVPSLPAPLEGQPYDTRLATRPEATMPARPVGELGIERGRVSPQVDPDLAAAVEDIRGGYAERTARELERESATGPRTVVMLKRSDFKTDEDWIRAVEATERWASDPSQFSDKVSPSLYKPWTGVLQVVSVATGGYAVEYSGQRVGYGKTEEAAIKAAEKTHRNFHKSPLLLSPAPEFAATTAPRTGSPSREEIGTRPGESFPQPPYAPQEQAPVEVLRNQPPGTPAQVAEGKPGEVSQAAGQGEAEAQQARVEKPKQFSPDEVIIMHSPFSNDDVEVSYRGPLGDKSVVWTGRQQMSIPTEWLRRKGEPLKQAENARPTDQPSSTPVSDIPVLPEPDSGLAEQKEMPKTKLGLIEELIGKKPDAADRSSNASEARVRWQNKMVKMSKLTKGELADRVRSMRELDAKLKGKSKRMFAIAPAVKARMEAAGNSWRSEAKKIASEHGKSDYVTFPENTLGEEAARLASYLADVGYSELKQSEQLSLGSTPSARPAQSLSKMQVEQAVRELFFDSATPPNFQVTHNYGKVFNGREVRGWYDPATGTIWLNAAYLRSPQEARAVFVEEAFHAIQNDKAVQKELSRLVASLTPEQLAEARSAYGNISEEQLRMEAVADILEKQQLTQEQRGILARLWDAVIGAIQRLYGKFTGKVFTERDAQDVLAKALKAAAQGKRTNVGGQTIFASNAVVVPPNKRDEAFSLTAHHGTPHLVDKFRTSRIGTGEGAQAYGWGLYFAENYEVALDYKKTLGGTRLLTKESELADEKATTHGSKKLLREARAVWSDNKTLDGYRQNLVQMRDRALSWARQGNSPENNRQYASDVDEVLKIIEGATLVETGNIYTVTLNVEPEDLLDWDKPLSEQSEKVKAVLLADLRKRHGTRYSDSELMRAEGEEIYKRLGWQTDGKYDYKAASASLESLGIKGIRYRDQGTRFAVPQKNYHIIPAKQGTSFIVNRGVNGQRLGEFPSYEQAEAWVLAQPDSNQPTYNYVIFNEDDIKITHANGQPVTVKEAQTEQALSVGPLQNQLDQQYLAAVQRGDMQEVQRLVDEAARGAGYSNRAFHGTKTGGFTRFNPRFAGTGVTSSNSSGGFYFSSSSDQASWFANPVTIERSGADLTESDVVVYGDGPFYALVGEEINRGPFPSEESARDWGNNIVDKWNSSNDGDVVFEDERVMQVFLDLGKSLKVDDMREFRDREKGVFSDGFDSLVVEDVVDGDGVGNVYVVKNPTQIKSADPITYDDSGNIIPISQRFQQESPDIRYSLGAPVSQSDATEVQGRAIEPSLVAAASRAVADLGRQQVEEFEQAGRELEGLAYESKSFRNARSELNNLVSLHEGRLRQLPQDRVTDDMRANIRDGVSIENGQIVVGDELVTKLAQMGVQFRPELVKALQAEVYFEQQARRLVDNLGKLATLKELKDYYDRIKAPADEIEKLDKLIAAKEKVVASLTPVTTNRGRGQQSIGERAGEIVRANASKVELQAKRDALNLDPVQEFFGKGITELRDLSEKAKAAADLTRALMDSSTSISEVARLGEIYDKWASFDATVKDALKRGTLTDEQRASVLTSLQRSFEEFDLAKAQMDDLLNSEEKGLLKDIRLAEADIADAKVTSGLADVLVADALKAAKGEMGLTGTVGDAANIANLEASTGAITTLAANLGRTLDQNRWLYDFLMAPGSMPAFGASVAQSLGLSETALREVLKVVQKSPSLASAIVTLADDAAAKLANSPPLQMQSIAQLATSGNPVGMALAANLTSQIVQQANAQGTKANASRQAAARQLAKSVLRLRTLQQGQALFNQTANSPAFQRLRSAANAGAAIAQKMVVLGPTGPVLRGFKSAAKDYQPELKIDVANNPLELSKTRDKVWSYLQNAEQYVADYEAAAALHAASPANPSPSQLGFDVADYNGLKFAIENQISPMFLNMGDMDDAARAAQYLTPVAVRKLMKAPMFIKEVFSQYEQIGKMVGGFAGNTFRQQIAKYKRGYLNAKRVASQFQDLPKLQSAAMRSHNIKNEESYRRLFNEMAHYGRLFGTPLRVGFTLPISNQIVTKEDMEFLKRTLAFEEKLRREVTEIDPVTGVRYMRGGKEITRRGAYVGDLGMPRHLNRDATQFIADVTNAYAATPKGFTPATDLSSSSTDEAVKYWNQHLGTLKQHILDSLRTDRTFKQTAEMATAEKRIAARWLAGNMNQVNSVQDLVDLIAAEIPATNGINPLDTARQGLNNELLQYVSHAQRIQKERADDNAKNSGLSIALSSDNEFTKPAANLELPSEYYDYGAVSSIDRITALSRANHSSLVDFANSLRLSITELQNRIARLGKATTDKEREAILENYKGNPQEMQDVLDLLRNSLKNFEDSYRSGGPDIIPTKLGQKLLKATVGSVLAKVEIAARNLSQGQIQVLTNLWAMNYMSASLAAWKALSNVPRGVINTGYLVARNIAGFADRRLGRDPQFQRTLKGAVDMLADGIFKSAQLALLKPRVGAQNARASFERVQALGFDISDDWWETAKQAWTESGQFRTQLDQDNASAGKTARLLNVLERIANTGADGFSAFVRGSVLEASDLNMNALSLGLVGNMEQRLGEVAMVFGKRLTDAGITEIDPANKDSILKPSEWLPSLNQQTAMNSLAEIRKFLESSASSEGFQLEKSLLQYYQDKMAGKPARIFNQRTFDAVQRSMIAENNAALPTNRASAGQASTLWRTMLALTGYPADAMLKLLRVSTGGSRDRKVVLQALSKMTAAVGFAAMAILFQGAGDAGSEFLKRKLQGKKADRVTPLDADFWTDPDHMTRAMGRYLLMSAYYLGDFINGAYGWVDGRSTIDPTQKAFVFSTASQILRDITSGAKIAMKGGNTSEVLEPLRRTMTRLTFGAPELEYLLGKDRDTSEAARRAMAENARAKGFDIPAPGFGGTVGLTNVKRKALSQAVSDMDIAQRKGDAEGYAKAKAAAQKQITELEAYYLKQRLEAGDSPEVAAKTAKASVWGDYQENNPVTAALGGKRPTAEQYKQLVESSTGERGQVIRQGIKAWQDGAQALFGKPGNITKEDVAENRPGGTVREPSYGRVSLTGGVSGRMKPVGVSPSRGRRAKIRRISLTGRRRKISPMRSRRKKIRRVRLTA